MSESTAKQVAKQGLSCAETLEYYEAARRARAERAEEVVRQRDGVQVWNKWDVMLRERAKDRAKTDLLTKVEDVGMTISTLSADGDRLKAEISDSQVIVDEADQVITEGDDVEGAVMAATVVDEPVVSGRLDWGLLQRRSAEVGRGRVDRDPQQDPT